MLTEAMIVAIAEAVKAAFDYHTELLKAMSPEQRAQVVQWYIDDGTALRKLLDPSEWRKLFGLTA